MHISTVLALLVAGAIAGPVHHKHHHAKKEYVYETDLDIVYTTVWVTEGFHAPTSTPAPAAPAATSAIVSAAPAAPALPASSAAPAAPAASNFNLVKAKPQPAAQASNVAVVPVASPAAVPASSDSPSTTNSAPASGSSASDPYQNAVLIHHNVHRQNHSAPNIQWDANLAAIAYDEASVCHYAHNVTGGGGGYGQNIAAGVHADNVSTILTDMFYNAEMPYYTGMYGDENPDFTNFELYGHFTQMVWSQSTHVGCATYDCTSRGLSGVDSDVAPYFTVCNYGPAGNMGGEYGTNIGEPKGMATVTWNYMNAE